MSVQRVAQVLCDQCWETWRVIDKGQDVTETEHARHTCKPQCTKGCGFFNRHPDCPKHREGS